MFPMLPPGRAPGPLRITVGILLMMLVAMWTFATPQARAGETAPDVVTERVHSSDAATEVEGERLDLHNLRLTALTSLDGPLALVVAPVASITVR